MSAARCQSCDRELKVGDTAYAADWKVLSVSGASVGTRWETRYTCEPCELKGDDS